MTLADHHREGELLADQGTIGGIPVDPAVQTKRNKDRTKHCRRETAIRLRYCTAGGIVTGQRYNGRDTDQVL
jgi:hypothetical protein